MATHITGGRWWKETQYRGNVGLSLSRVPLQTPLMFANTILRHFPLAAKEEVRNLQNLFLFLLLLGGLGRRLQSQSSLPSWKIGRG